MPETTLEMAERHIREGDAHVARQRELVEKLRRENHSTQAAESLLQVFEDILVTYRQHLQQLRSDADTVDRF